MNNTLANGIKLLEFLASTADAYSVKELAEHFELPNSHIHRLLQTLKESGYIEQVMPGKKYKISLQVLCLSNACLSQLLIRRRLRPFLAKLSNQINQTIYLSVPFNWQPLIIDVFYAKTNLVDSGLAIGSINPIHCSATGKICAAYHPKESLDDFLTSFDYEIHTNKTIKSPEEFKAVLPAIREDALAICDEERAPKMVAASAPVFNEEHALTAIIGVVIPHRTKKRDEIIDQLKETAESCSYTLGYLP